MAAICGTVLWTDTSNVDLDDEGDDDVFIIRGRSLYLCRQKLILFGY